MLNALAYDAWILHALIWLPFVGMVHVLWAPGARAKHLALYWSLAVFVSEHRPVVGLRSGVSGGGYQTRRAAGRGIEQWGVSYALGLDGISLFLVMLTTFTTPLAILGSFNYIKRKEKSFYALMLLVGGRSHRCLFRGGSLPLLRVLRAHPRSDVLHRRDLGRRAQRSTRR